MESDLFIFFFIEHKNMNIDAKVDVSFIES